MPRVSTRNARRRSSESSRPSTLSWRGARRWRGSIRAVPARWKPSGWTATGTSQATKMADALVLDASVAIAIARREPQANAAGAALYERASRNQTVHVPGHFWLELANVFARRHGMSPSEILQGVR